MKRLSLSHQLSLPARFAWERMTGHMMAERDRLGDIRRVMELAYRHTDFYRAKFDEAGVHPADIRSWEDFALVPTTSKAQLIGAGKTAIVPDRAAAAFISRTSGSSGRFLDLYEGADFWVKDGIIGIEGYRRHVGLAARDHILYCNTSEYPYRSVGGLLYRVTYFDNLRPVDELISTLRSGRMNILMVYPSVAAELLDLLRAKGSALKSGIRLKAIITHSEHSAQSFRNELAAYFSCPVSDEYATEELGRVSVQCRLGTRHLLEAQSYCEVLRLENDHPVAMDEAGELVGTCLVNTTMPIIRYRQGDMAAFSQTDCGCGVSGRTIQEIHGRNNSSFQLPDGRTLASGKLLDWTYQLILTCDLDIKQFQLVQTHPNRAVLHVITGPDYCRGRDDHVIDSSFRQQLSEDVTIEVVPVERIPKTLAGKHIPIQSRVPRKGPPPRVEVKPLREGNALWAGGRVLSVNVSTGRANSHAEMGRTGIDKRPVAGPVQVKRPGPRGIGGSGLTGDQVCDLRFHGGDDQAVYAYAREDLDAWAEDLGRSLRPGQFGENLTTTGVDITNARIGDRWMIGEQVVLEIAMPRTPCRNFARWLDERGWVKTFMRRAIPGAYLRVVEPGKVQAGDPVVLIHRPAHEVTVGLVFRALSLEPHLLPRLLDADTLPERARKRILAQHLVPPEPDDDPVPVLDQC